MEEAKVQGYNSSPRPLFIKTQLAHHHYYYKGKTLTILNRCAENPEEFVNKWTGGCKLTCSFLDTYIWHILRNNSIGKQMRNLIGYLCPGMKRLCNIKTRPTPEPMKFKCSKLFNLMTDVGTTNQKLTTRFSTTEWVILN